MSRYIVLMIVLFTASAGPSLTELFIPYTGTAYAADAEARPKAKFLNKKFKFGSVKKGEVLSHDFTIVNKGNAVLKIEALIPA